MENYVFNLIKTKNTQQNEQVISELVNEIRTAIYETTLTTDEMEIIYKYRALPIKDKKEIQAFIDLKQESSAL
ncbi:hypothetical protein MKY96_26035 [Paenibacillus sp. FSL R7-0302]|uniref:hypothetical protein n=1 Tax=Paenibacillus sp. FSL R7-0302 TaxID=2921681 RepID=UPI0030FCDD86